MRKQIFILMAAALTLVACHKPATEEQQPAVDTVAVEIIEETAAADMFIDFTALTPNGVELSVSDLVGKTDYLLLDFWASWCGPCRRFIPVLKEIYAGQPAGHFQILSCSIDRDNKAWLIALSEEQMPWPQVRQDEDHNCSDLYDVQFIPHTVLIDRQGHIIGVNLEEPEIEEILFN